MNDISTILLYEILGTATLLLLGCGVVANVALAGSKGEGGGFLLVNFGWGIGVFAGVYVACKSGAHLNPAVTVGLLASGADEYAPDIAVNVANTLTYFAAELLGAFLGAVLAGWRTSSTSTPPRTPPRSSACSPPDRRSATRVWNILTEVIGTFVLVYWILQSATRRPRSARSRSPWSSSASAPPSAVRPATPSTPPVTSVRASPTPCCRSAARAAATGATPGCPSSAR